MTPEDFERLRSWMSEIAETLLPAGTAFADEGDERKFRGLGGFWVNQRRGLWYSFKDGKGGRSAISLIAHLKPCTEAEALEWAEAWLASHPGMGGTGTADNGDDTHHRANVAEAKSILIPNPAE